MPKYALDVIVLLLLVCWLLGWLVFPFAGAFIHVILVLVIAVFALRVIQARKPTA